MFNFFIYFFANQTLGRAFIFLFTIASIFVFIFPNYLYPDFDSLNRYFQQVLNALFSDSDVVISYTPEGEPQEHKLFSDQLFLTPQLKLIQFLNIFLILK